MTEPQRPAPNPANPSAADATGAAPVGVDATGSGPVDGTRDRAARGVPGCAIVVVLIVGAIVMASTAVGYHLFQASRLVSYFGAQPGATIQRSEEATLFVRADPDENAADAIELDGIRWKPYAPGRNEADRDGWTHARSALLAAESYDWNDLPPAESLDPDALLRFQRPADDEGPIMVDVMLDWDASALLLHGKDLGLRMSDQKRDALRTYLLEAEDASPFRIRL